VFSGKGAVRERKKLAYGGAISLVVTVDKKTHEIPVKPQITFQGAAGLDPTNGFAGEARQAISEDLRLHLKRLVQREIQSKPVIVTTIVEV
jgi:mRNA degradation ribonuclease J1/J2